LFKIANFVQLLQERLGPENNHYKELSYREFLHAGHSYYHTTNSIKAVKRKWLSTGHLPV